MDRSRLKTQLDRLHRHYLSCTQRYDEVSLLDLSHSLRIWMELKDSISEADFPLIARPVFLFSTPSPKLNKKLKLNTFFWAGFTSKGVTTRAHQGNLLSGPTGEKGTYGIGMEEKDGTLRVTMVYAIEGATDERDLKSQVFGQQNDGKAKYMFWLNTEAVRMKTSSGMVSLSKEMLVKRVANSFDGSHPSADATPGQQNRFDPYVDQLMKYSCGGLPVPYFVCLKIAQDILKTMPSILGLPEYV